MQMFAGVQGRVDDAIAELERLRKSAEADEQRAADLRRDADRLSALLRQTRCSTVVTLEQCMTVHVGHSSCMLVSFVS